MMIEPKDTRAVEVYRQIMQWLEQGRSTGPQTLFIPVKSGEKICKLGFRRVATMGGGGSYAESIADPRVHIAYDPNWESLVKIEGLIEAAERG